MRLYIWFSVVCDDGFLDHLRTWSEIDAAQPTGELAGSIEECQQGAVADLLISIEKPDDLKECIDIGLTDWSFDEEENVWRFYSMGELLMYMGVRHYEFKEVGLH